MFIFIKIWSFFVIIFARIIPSILNRFCCLSRFNFLILFQFIIAFLFKNLFDKLLKRERSISIFFQIVICWIIWRRFWFCTSWNPFIRFVELILRNTFLKFNFPLCELYLIFVIEIFDIFVKLQENYWNSICFKQIFRFQKILLFFKFGIEKSSSKIKIHKDVTHRFECIFWTRFWNKNLMYLIWGDTQWNNI